MINENKLIEYMYKHKYITYQDNLEHSMQGIVERFLDEVEK